MPRTSRDERRVALGQRPQTGERLVAADAGVLDEAVLEQLDRRERRGAGDRVAAVGRAVGARPPGLEQFGTGDHRAKGHARGDALGGQQDVGLDAPVLDRPHLAGPTRARLDLVGDEQDAVLVADPPQALEEAVLGDDVAALALDRLDDDRRDLVRRREPVEQDLVEPAQVLDPAERRVEDPGQQRPEARVVLRLRGRQAQRSVGAPVEGAEERDDVRPLRGVSRELDGRLDDLGAGVAEVDPATAGHRGEAGQLATDLRVDRQEEVTRAEVDELGGLFLDGRDHLRVAMPGRGHRDAGREVEEEVAVDVLDRQPLPANRHDRVRPRQAG